MKQTSVKRKATMEDEDDDYQSDYEQYDFNTRRSTNAIE